MTQLPEVNTDAEFERQYAAIFNVPAAAFVKINGVYLNAHMQACYLFYCGQIALPRTSGLMTCIGWTWYDPEIKFATDERMNGKHMMGTFFSLSHIVEPTRDTDAVNLYAYTSTLAAVKKCKK